MSENPFMCSYMVFMYDVYWLLWFMKYGKFWVLVNDMIDKSTIHEYWCYMRYMNVDTIWDTWIWVLHEIHEYWYYMKYWYCYGHMSIDMIWDIGLHGYWYDTCECIKIAYDSYGLKGMVIGSLSKYLHIGLYDMLR